MRTTRTPLAITSVLALAALILCANAAPVSENRDVLVHLFNWPWDSVAKECTEVLGPKGYYGVQISPPQEHVVLPGDAHPWWQDYQPISYKLITRRGDREAFARMIKTCKDAGVKIYADAVINHMARYQSGIGSAGTRYTRYEFPGTYSYRDFHHDQCPPSIDYNQRWQVQRCELDELADLDTASPYVQNRLKEYLNDLLSLGVAGFRVDAAKHIDSGELGAILNAVGGAKFTEVIGSAGEPIQVSEYLGMGKVTEFKFAEDVSRMFRYGNIADLPKVGGWQTLKSEQAVVFIDNHDTQRGQAGEQRQPLTYKDGQTYAQAEAFMLAYPYGQPVVMSSYTFNQKHQGPPAFNDGTTKQVECGNGWECEHRWKSSANLVALRSAAWGTGMNDVWTNGNNQLAFGRGDKAFVGFNRGEDLTRTFQTGLPAGTYCDVANGDVINGKCTGPVYTVDSSRKVTAKIPSNGVLALHVNARVEGQTTDPIGTCSNGQSEIAIEARVTTVPGEDVYVVGNVSELGSWNPVSAVKLSSATYPVWKGTVKIPLGKTVEYKLIKKTATNTIWADGGNKRRETGTACKATWYTEW
ncbi:alpha-amylase [Catenaria anguillulae PL171]|uniref:Alpha-amylase n=1 Tax=Catenaria anguillulae PL171 TaxID=765915 RepID=A0A1Y2HAJ9_9FUNG|nr:alpha-amylase [Catenaria anguillulae PL171]